MAAWNAGNTSGPCFPTCFNPDGHGAVYIFRYSGTAWVEETILLGDDPTVGSWDNFGSDVALSEEWLIAGASGDDDAVLNAGAAYIFRNEGAEPGRWSMHAKLTPPDGELGDFLGEGADIEGDLAVVGSQSDDIDGVPAVGSAYVWQRTGESWDFQGKLVASDGNEFRLRRQLGFDREQPGRGRGKPQRQHRARSRRGVPVRFAGRLRR